MAEKGKWKENAVYFIVGIIVMLVLSFASIYNEQPKAYNCERAATACGLAQAPVNTVGTSTGGSSGSSCSTTQCPVCDDPVLDTDPTVPCGSANPPFGSSARAASTFCGTQSCSANYQVCEAKLQRSWLGTDEWVCGCADGILV